jgi:ketosteroid isomerase-like protein
MSTLLRCLLLTLLLAAPVAAAPTAMEAAVLAAEQARVTALIHDDFAALEHLLADELTYTHSNASVDTKEQFLSFLRSGRLKYRELDHSDQRVRLYGETAILTGRTRVQSVFEGQEMRLTLRFTIVYIQRAGRWQMAAWHSARVP